MGRVKRRIAKNKKVRSPEEDALSSHQTKLLKRAGYDYRDNAWRPPKRGSSGQGQLVRQGSKEARKRQFKAALRKRLST